MSENKTELNHAQLKVLRDKAKKANEEYFFEQSKKRLDKIISTKMTTCFIGAIAAFEQYFGFLWNHGVNDDMLDNTEKEMRELWQQARNAILNHGNNQLRAIKSEIMNHDIHWNRHKMILPIRPLQEEGKEG